MKQRFVVSYYSHLVEFSQVGALRQQVQCCQLCQYFLESFALDFTASAALVIT